MDLFGEIIDPPLDIGGIETQVTDLVVGVHSGLRSTSN